MAPQEFLFVNKGYGSPSLSRNTGSEASLASQVNKYVQQQRFWKNNAPRKNWYRPFQRDGSSGPTSPSGSSTSDEHQFECLTPRSIQQRVPKRRSTPRSEMRIVKRPSNDVQIRSESLPPALPTIVTFEICSPLSNRVGDGPDAFNPIFPRITNLLRHVIDGYMTWATTSSVTEQTVKEGTRWVHQNILTNVMHSMAFLAAATAHERKTDNLILPVEQGPEFFSSKGTQLVREYLATNNRDPGDYVFIDIYRLALCEWLMGKTAAARIHFHEIARQYGTYQPRTLIDQHHLEIITTADLFLAIHIDEAPYMPLTWEPELPVAPYPRTTTLNPLFERCSARHGDNLLDLLVRIQPSMFSIMERCFREFALFPDAISIDYAAPVSGPIWAIKRRMQGTIVRLQKLKSSMWDDCIRRTLVIILFLATTHAARRTGRTNVALLAQRLKTALISAEKQQSRSPSQHSQISSPTNQHLNSSPVQSQYFPSPSPPAVDIDEDPELWMWMYTTGLAAAKEEPVDQEVLEWFSGRAVNMALMISGGIDLQRVTVGLSGYMMFKRVHQSAVMHLVGQDSRSFDQLRLTAASSESSPENWERIGPEMVQNYEQNYSRDMRT